MNSVLADLHYKTQLMEDPFSRFVKLVVSLLQKRLNKMCRMLEYKCGYLCVAQLKSMGHIYQTFRDFLRLFKVLVLICDYFLRLKQSPFKVRHCLVFCTDPRVIT
ncbi:hypothetical protein GDO81_011189 [Engystomops pustulosus]|uniref:Uncharacterized protein n=1 Tax=Engystomops pustulosus TaxID=76066 RepID=A0AAV7BCF8_ENGPU|nr:hypothetical protein GDO81_011189 [Engystomops pustulosus]